MDAYIFFIFSLDIPAFTKQEDADQLGEILKAKKEKITSISLQSKVSSKETYREIMELNSKIKDFYAKSVVEFSDAMQGVCKLILIRLHKGNRQHRIHQMEPIEDIPMEVRSLRRYLYQELFSRKGNIDGLTSIGKLYLSDYSSKVICSTIIDYLTSPSKVSKKVLKRGRFPRERCNYRRGHPFETHKIISKIGNESTKKIRTRPHGVAKPAETKVTASPDISYREKPSLLGESRSPARMPANIDTTMTPYGISQTSNQEDQLDGNQSISKPRALPPIDPVSEKGEIKLTTSPFSSEIKFDDANEELFDRSDSIAKDVGSRGRRKKVKSNRKK